MGQRAVVLEEHAARFSCERTGPSPILFCFLTSQENKWQAQTSGVKARQLKPVPLHLSHGAPYRLGIWFNLPVLSEVPGMVVELRFCA